MNRAFAVLASLLAFAPAAPRVAAQPATGTHLLTPEQWRADLRFLAQELPRIHRNAFHRIARDQLEKEVSALHERIPALADHEVILGLARIVALIGDGHTRLSLPEDPRVAFDQAHSSTPPPAKRGLLFHHFPLKLYLYSDGLFVQAATAGYRRAVGAEVVRIGSASVTQALEKVRPLVPCDNEQGFRLWAPTRLVIPEVLHAVGIARDRARANFVLRDSLGREFSLELRPMPLHEQRAWLDVREIKPSATALLPRGPTRPFWLEYREPQRVLYAQINRIGDQPDETLAQFARRLGDSIERRPVEKVVLDLRGNPGGDNTLNRSLVLALARSDKVNRPGRLFVVIGRGTFSAAMTLASQLEYWTHALFVGEPTGASPSGYGDSRRITLPNSGLTVRIATVYWRDWSASEDRSWIAPDLPAEISSRDDRAHRDPALEAIVDYTPRDSLLPLMRTAIRRSGLASAALTYFKLRTDPLTATQRAEDALVELGHELAGEGKLDDALGVMAMNVREHPNSARAHGALAEIYARRRQTANAIESYRRAVAIDPHDAAAAQALRRLGKPSAARKP